MKKKTLYAAPVTEEYSFAGREPVLQAVSQIETQSYESDESVSSSEWFI